MKKCFKLYRKEALEERWAVGGCQEKAISTKIQTCYFASDTRNSTVRSIKMPVTKSFGKMRSIWNFFQPLLTVPFGEQSTEPMMKVTPSLL